MTVENDVNVAQPEVDDIEVEVTGADADDHYMQIDLDGCCTWVLPEFTLMSRRPGIGKAWFDKYKDDVFPSDEVPIPGKGIVNGVPRYYGDLYARLDADGMEEVKRLRQVFRREHGCDFSPARLMDKYKVKKAQVDMLKRSL
jgi:hypothetical protein